MTPLLEFAQTSFWYGDRRVLDKISANLSNGECVALVGPNGIGKTTLLRLAAGTLSPAAGEVRLVGQPLDCLKQQAIARSIALVPQNVDVPFAFTVEQFIEQGRTPFLRMFGGLQASDRRAVEEAMAAYRYAIAPRAHLQSVERRGMSTRQDCAWSRPTTSASSPR